MEKKMLSLEIPAALREALRKRAYEEDVSISKLIRQILEKELAKELEKVHNNGK